MEFQKLLDSITTIDDLQKTESHEKIEFLNYFWVLIRENKVELLKEIETYLEEKNKEKIYIEIKEYVKRINKEYYDFEYFRDEKISDINKIYLINQIFTDQILINKGTLSKISIPELPKEKLASICYWTKRVVYFCINNNYDGSTFINTLNEYYHIDIKLLEDIKKLYNDNILMLKINNLTNILNEGK